MGLSVKGRRYITFADLIAGDHPEIATCYPMMRDCMVEGEYQHKGMIIYYLKNAPYSFGSMSAEPLIDIFSGEPIKGVARGGGSDGVYSWPNVLAYYVEHYNVGLPEYFVSHILADVRARIASTR